MLTTSINGQALPAHIDAEHEIKATNVVHVGAIGGSYRSCIIDLTELMLKQVAE